MILISVLLIALDLIELKGPDGQTAWVNTHEITGLRAPVQGDLRRHFPNGTQCIVTLTDGKFVSAVEPCTALRNRLQSGLVER